MAVTATEELLLPQWGAGSDPFTRAQLDAAFSALEAILSSRWKKSVRLATAAALAAYTRASNVITANANGAMATVDGVAPAAGDRILLKNGAANADNGIYVVTSLGSGGTPFVLTRATDANSSALMKSNSAVLVEEGTVNAGRMYRLSTANPITLNTTGLTWTMGPAGFLELAGGTLAGLVNFADQILQRPELKDYAETVSAHGAMGSTETFDCEVANVHTSTADANCTFTFSNPPATGKAGTLTLLITNDGTARSITWPASVKWVAGTAPTMTGTNNKVDIFTFVTVDGGTTWYGFVGGQNY